MKIARVKHRNTTAYARIEEDAARLIDGDIFGIHTVTDTVWPLADCRLLAPVAPRQVLALGLNYRRHAAECGNTLPDEPLLFIKSVSAVTGPNSPIILPSMAPDEVDYEAELVIVIGRDCRNIDAADADAVIFGYTCGNDVSARDCQLRRDSQWARGKSFDTFAPLGPWIVTGIDGDNLGIRLTLNGQVMQDSTTADLVFSCRRLVAFLSRCMTLYAGSVIMTGTPSGVGAGRDPKVYLKPGDAVTVSVEGIGDLTNHVVSES